MQKLAYKSLFEIMWLRSLWLLAADLEICVFLWREGWSLGYLIYDDLPPFNRPITFELVSG